MRSDMGSIRYCLREPFERAARSVCECLTGRGLQITGCVDLSNRIERRLGLVVAPCRIIFVLPNPTLLRRNSIYPSAACLLPLHVVISGNDLQTEVLVSKRIRPSHQAAAEGYDPVMETQSKMAEAIDAIAMRSSFVM
jgi:hypothetical protein